MKNIWKWILGILLVLVVFTALGFLAFNTFGVARFNRLMGADEFNRPPMMDRLERDDWRSPMGGYGNWRHPMMGGHGFVPFWASPFSMGFLFFGWLLRLLFPLGILALAVYFSYQMGKRAGASAAAALAAPASGPDPGPAEAPRRGRKVAQDE